MAKAKRALARRPVKTHVSKTKKKKTPPASTALARPGAVAPAVEAPIVALDRVLGEGIALGQLGFQPLTLSDEANAILNEPVDEAKVLVKPNGAVYYSHIEYTRIFNRAFGRARWALVPANTPKLMPMPKQGATEDEDRVRQLAMQTFVFFVEGKPIAQATGEQEYHEHSAEQSYADVIEALNASALRRVAKRIGVSLELWDSRWTQRWLDTHAVKVWVRGRKKPQWRRKDDPPFYGEGQREQSSGGQRTSGQTPSRGYTSSKDEEPITPEQRKRLYTIASRHKRSHDDVKAHLAKIGYASSKDVKRKDYDAVVQWVESGNAPGVVGAPARPQSPPEVIDAEMIPWGDDREPGSDG